MRKHYTASYFVGRLGQPGPGIVPVAEECVRWIREKSAPGTADAIVPGEDMLRTQVGNGGWVEAVGAQADGRTYWGVRLGHPDSQDEDVEWQTEIRVSHDSAGERTAFGCTLLVGARTGRVTPARRDRSRPRVVRDVLRRWGGHYGYSLTTGAITVSRHEADDFVTLLSTPERSRPIVLVSKSNRTGLPAVDTGKLADWLAGVAHVVVEADGCSRDIGTRIPRRLHCWDGAVRVYWPGFTVGDEPYKHRHWAPWEIAEIDDERRPHGFVEYLLAWISETAVFTTDPAVPSWSELEVLRRARLLEEARHAGNHEELLEMAWAEIAQKDTRIAELLRAVEEAGTQLQEARAQKESFEQAYLELCRGPAVEATPSSPMAVPLRSVREAIARAEASFQNGLVIALNGQSDGLKSLFESPQELWTALEFLATTYRDAKLGTHQCDDFDAALRSANGWRFLGRHADLTMKRYENWYTTLWESRRYLLSEHLGTGSSKDPRRAIRVGFCWDEEHQKVIVGFIGQHQKTDAT